MKKGDKVISVYWFAILILVVGGVVAMVNIFYNSSYDVRGVEANILTNKVADCFSKGGYLTLEVFSSKFLLNSSNFLEICSLDFGSEKLEEEGQYYSEVNIFLAEDKSRNVFNVSQGNKNLKADCEFEKDYGNLAVCVERDLFALDPQGNLYLIEILSIVGKVGKNA